MNPVSRNRFWVRLRPYVFVMPAMIFIFTFVLYPVIELIMRSFQQWNMVKPPKWVGFDNYAYNFRKKEFWDAIWHTCIYAVSVVGIGMTLASIIAVWLSKNTFINDLTRTIMFMPHIISLLSVAMVWTWIMNKDNGLLNIVLGFFKIPPLKWIDSSDTALMSIIIVSMWKGMGYDVLLIFAALQTVPKDLFEAADLDGAGPVTRFVKITVPMISPQLFMLLVTSTIGSFKVFESVSIMTKGGPGTSTQVLVYFIYKQAFIVNKIGLAAAAGVVLMFIVGITTVIYFGVLSRRVHYQ